jgi:putative flippase GtrA
MMEKHREPIMYVIFGGFTTIVNWLAYALFVWAGIELNASNILSWIVGVLFAFVVNKWFVFLSKSTKSTVVIRELGSFVGARIFTGIIAWVLFPIFIALGMNQSLLGVQGYLAKITTSIIEIILNWIFSKYLIFIHKEEQEPE